MARKLASPPISAPAQNAEVIDPPSEHARQDELSGGTLLKRKETAQRLGWSESKVRRSEGSILNPIVADGVHYFRAEEIETIRRVHVDSRQSPTDYDGPQAARVFTLLDDGVDPVEIVKRTSLDPRKVEAIRVQWASMLGGFIVTDRHLDQIEMMAWVIGTFPMQSGDELVDALRHSADDALCAHCHKGRPFYCNECVQGFAEAEETVSRVEAEQERIGLERVRRKRHRSTEEWRKMERRAAVKKRAGSPPSNAVASQAQKSRIDMSASPEKANDHEGR